MSSVFWPTQTAATVPAKRRFVPQQRKAAVRPPFVSGCGLCGVLSLPGANERSDLLINFNGENAAYKVWGLFISVYLSKESFG